MKATHYNLEDAATRAQGIDAAVEAIAQKKTIVIPTDTVYGIAADAFSAEAVSDLLAAKGRTRTMPPPVLIFDRAVLPGLADGVSEEVNQLAEAFWPGALTLILYSQPSLQWDLGETKGTVALRVPNDPVAIDLLRSTGPLAVSSANKTGRPAATTAAEAAAQLGEDVELILDGGQRPLDSARTGEEVLPSTIIDCTSDRFVVVREGAIPVERLREVVPSIVTKAELEAQEKASRLTPLEETALVVPAPASDADFETEDLEPVAELDRKAPAAAAGSLESQLLAASAQTAVDQRRSATAKRPEAPASVELTTPPLAVAEAYALVYGAVKDETAGFAPKDADSVAEAEESLEARASEVAVDPAAEAALGEPELEAAAVEAAAEEAPAEVPALAEEVEEEAEVAAEVPAAEAEELAPAEAEAVQETSAPAPELVEPESQATEAVTEDPAEENQPEELPAHKPAVIPGPWTNQYPIISQKKDKLS